MWDPWVYWEGRVGGVYEKGCIMSWQWDIEEDVAKAVDETNQRWKV